MEKKTLSVPSSEYIEQHGYPKNKADALKIGSSIHKAIRKHIRPFLKPGLKLSELANLIENKCKELTKEEGVNKGIGFPSSLSVTKIRVLTAITFFILVVLGKAALDRQQLHEGCHPTSRLRGQE